MFRLLFSALLCRDLEWAEMTELSLVGQEGASEVCEATESRVTDSSDVEMDRPVRTRLDWRDGTGRNLRGKKTRGAVVCWLDRGSRFETTTDEQNKEKAPLVASQDWMVRYRYRWER